ncbi:dehydrodolichyl diphosphate synthase complex subunit NUS1-like [Coffea eugenioides]|uniref:dehydrodolichyl diphosphate synthase complex subunit NUS1-like n=1 Tax=Coffea eugenioides TaxID=49369 RepID=UPI000F60895C|nr:dehydrodolichyl diphosphate synthase complex subunit NUS1-like [Coffea eugenioides]
MSESCVFVGVIDCMYGNLLLVGMGMGSTGIISKACSRNDGNGAGTVAPPARILKYGNETQELLKWASRLLLNLLQSFYAIGHICDAGVEIWVFVHFGSFCILPSPYGISKKLTFRQKKKYGISKVLELLQWVADIGVKSVCLYDPEGVLKKNKEPIMQRFSSANLSEEAAVNGRLVTRRNLTLEFVSFEDGKEAVAKAANYLFVKHYANGTKEKSDFTEPQMAEALGAIGSGGADPDLLLIYGPTRCHLGFPAWRLRYTEIVHMGPLKSMSYGSLVKAIFKYTMVHQNYGS